MRAKRKRAKSRRKVAPGWWWRLPLTMAFVALPFVLAAPTVGHVLGNVSDWFGGSR